MRSAIRVVLATGFLALAETALAHPGHGLDTSGVGLLHFLLDLGHGGSALLVAIVVACVAAIAVSEARRGGRD